VSSIFQTLSTPKGSLARIALDEIADDERAHRLRAASWKFQRRLHDIETAYFEAQAKARSEYLEEVEAISGRCRVIATAEAKIRELIEATEAAKAALSKMAQVARRGAKRPSWAR
jgi:hypothetical protein